MNYFWLKGKREGHAGACEGGIASLHEFGIIDSLSLSLSSCCLVVLSLSHLFGWLTLDSISIF
jgi:hypothetical protein